MKEARNAAKEKKRLLLERKDHSNIAIDDAWDPLVDEDDENLIWDDSDYSENSIPCVDLTDSIGRDDPEFNRGGSSTPASKEGDSSCQDNPEERGTPSHVLGNLPRVPRNGQCSEINRQRANGSKEISGRYLVLGAEGVDAHMSQYKVDMATVNQKLDSAHQCRSCPRESASDGVEHNKISP
ncbi:hypothetical protein KC19_12G040700 [Ceratodon purpureus]|uniref:Uncharacterized protein n=1 Tax=Ceratodon purpureus TaxID=3225 RepID=A0A8T0G7G2_CERPU|nr:hypothetical protein KC19_12G040700 [Ceratodon purpureus]